MMNVSVTVGHLDKMPTCEHGRLQAFCERCRIHAKIERLRADIRAESISYDGIYELHSLARHIEPGDVELLQWAGVDEL